MSDTHRTVLHNTADVLLRTVLPTLEGEHTRAVVLQLAAVARFAAMQGDDPSKDRAAGLAAVIIRHLSEAAVAALAPDPLSGAEAVMRTAAVIMSGAVTSGEESLRRCAAELRALLVADLDTDLLAEEPLIDAFRGRMPA